MAMKVGDVGSTGGSLGVVAGILKLDVRDKVYEYDPSITPLAKLLMALPKVTATAFKHEHIDYESPAMFTRINNGAGYASGDLSFVVDDVTGIGVGDLVKIQRTDEVILVATVTTSTDTFTCASAGRSWGGTAAAALLDNDVVQIMGGAAIEGAASELSRMQDEVFRFNYLTDARDPYGVSDILEASNTYGGKTLQRKRAQRMLDHKKKIEIALFFSERATVTSGTMRHSSMGGLKEFITTNTTDFGGALTYAAIVSSAQTVGRFSQGVALNLHCAPAVASNISMLAKEHLRKMDTAAKFGIHMDRLITQHMQYNIITEWLFEGDEYTKLAFGLNMKNLSYVSMQGGLDTHLRKDLQANSETSLKEEWRTVFSLERRLEKTHEIWTNAA